MPRLPRALVSYQHQLPALVAARCHAVAPDLRGNGQTYAPESVREYSLLHLVGDMVGLLEALGETRCVVVGHDERSPVASALGLFRSNLVRGVALRSVPYRARGDVDQLAVFPPLIGRNDDQVFFHEPGVVEAVLETDIRGSVRNILISASGVAAEVNTFLDGGDSILFTGLEGAPAPSLLTDEFLAGLSA